MHLKVGEMLVLCCQLNVEDLILFSVEQTDLVRYSCDYTSRKEEFSS